MEATAVEIVGEAGRIQPIEHMLIDSPLAAVLARVDAGTMERATSILSPALLLCGLALYAHRVSSAYQAKNPPRPKPQRQPMAQAEWGQRLEPVKPEQVRQPASRVTLTPDGAGG